MSPHSDGSDGGQPQERYTVVTTRSKLRSPRFFPQMMYASLKIRRQLSRTEGVVRWASVVAGPSEFWTITVWRSRHLMQEFMRSEAHGDIMWLFSKWLSAFWLMRWRPGAHELGAWHGMQIGEDHDDPAVGDERRRKLETVLKDMPELRAAFGPDGAPRYEDAPHVRRRRVQVQGAGGFAVRITSGPRVAEAVHELRHVARRLRERPEVLGVAVGMGKVGEMYMLAVWSDHREAIRFLEGAWIRQAAERWGRRWWVIEWLPENEFGHWDGRRLRTDPIRREVAGQVAPARS